MQRDIKAIVAAHKMDSRRRELYVEGKRDRAFFLWFLKSNGNRNSDAIVHEIDSIRFEETVEGGCRGRLLKFAADILSNGLAIRCFADADFDRLLKRAIPPNVWLTDCRDLEWYFLQSQCIDKVLHLALATQRHTPESVLAEISRLGRPMGILRLLSERENLKLPFQKRPPLSYLRRSKGKNGPVELDSAAYLQALLQGANVGLGRLKEFKEKIVKLSEETKDTPDSELIQGKDCIAILQAVLESDEFQAEAVEPSFWVSLEHIYIQGFPNLGAALQYLRQ